MLEWQKSAFPFIGFYGIASLWKQKHFRSDLLFFARHFKPCKHIKQTHLSCSSGCRPQMGASDVFVPRQETERRLVCRPFWRRFARPWRVVGWEGTATRHVIRFRQLVARLVGASSSSAGPSKGISTGTTIFCKATGRGFKQWYGTGLPHMVVCYW